MLATALLEERALTVAELAKRFEMGLLAADETEEDAGGKLQGRNLIINLTEHAKVNRSPLLRCRYQCGRGAKPR
jgi:hypothetical protein